MSDPAVSERIAHQWYARPVLFVSDLQAALRFYIDQGQTLNAQFGSSGGQNYLQEVSFSGYLVDR